MSDQKLDLPQVRDYLSPGIASEIMSGIASEIMSLV